MGFISGVMRFLLWVLVLWWSAQLLRRSVAWLLRGAVKPGERDRNAGSDAAEPAKNGARKLVRDPVCGVHIAQDRAIGLAGTEVVYFCSTSCRDQYAENGKKLAANG